MQTKIFLDSGSPEDTREALTLFGGLAGQTTNPSLIAKNPSAKKRILEGEKFSKDELNIFYKKVITEIAALIPGGAISIEVYVDANTTKDQIIKEANAMYNWCDNAYIKIPITKNGLEAAQVLSQNGMRLNMTLCFSQEQAAAVYGATKGAKPGQVFISPFDGRLDDIGLEGLDLVENIMKMYKVGDGHVKVLVASIRNSEHLIDAFKLKPDIVTIPITVLKDWAQTDKSMSKEKYSHSHQGRACILYKDLDLNKNWQNFNIEHDLTKKGLEKFASDWNRLTK